MTHSIQFINRDDVVAVQALSEIELLQKQIIELQNQLSELLQPAPSESETMKSTSKSASLG